MTDEEPTKTDRIKLSAHAIVHDLSDLSPGECMVAIGIALGALATSSNDPDRFIKGATDTAQKLIGGALSRRTVQ